MATANIKAVITAQDNASGVVQQFGKNVDKSTSGVVTSTKRASDGFANLAVAAVGASIASRKLYDVISDSVAAANKYQGALIGLNSIAKAFGHDADEARRSAEALAKDGLLTVADAARGLKNLLQSGFSLPQAIKLMERFKDSAAFGRQNALSFGEAVASATEGIKNGNSILVDNAGVTKNLSRILEEAGFSAQDLMKATTDLNVREALFNGIIKETNAQVGDAVKLTGTFAGKQAELEAKTTILKQTIGEALQPALMKLLEAITPLVEKFAKFTTDHPGVVAAVLLIGTVALGLIAILGTLGIAIQGVSAAFGVMAAVVAAPIIMPAIVVAAALAAIFLVQNAYNQLASEIDKTQRAISAFGDSRAQYIKSLGDKLRAGEIDRATYDKRLKSYNDSISQGHMPAGKATGGSVVPGMTYPVGENGAEMFKPLVAGSIVPNNQVTNNNSTPINITVQAGAFMGNKQDAREYAQMIMQALKDIAGSKNMSFDEMMRV